MCLKLVGAHAHSMVLALRKFSSASPWRAARYGWEKDSLSQSLKDLLQHLENICEARCMVVLLPPSSPQDLLSFQGSGPYPLSLGQRFSNLTGHQNPWSQESLFNNADFQVSRGFDSVYLRWDTGVCILTSSPAGPWVMLWVFLEDFSHWKKSHFPHID